VPDKIKRMVLSMTGYGKATAQLPGKKITVEIRSLNSKQTDVNVRLPQFYREKELEVRELMATQLGRGKIDFSMYAELTGEEDAPNVNKPLVLSYIKQLEEIKRETGIDGDSLAVAMRMPDVLKTEKEALSAEEWKLATSVISSAIEQLIGFRKQEGDSLKADFLGRIEAIRHALTAIQPYEESRITTVKERLLKNLEGINVNQDRYEQELIFYIEKLDINEEKVRLSNHLDYFIDVMNSEEQPGKKLGFISQEIGREINTLGSKANHAAIQKLVVQMKEELERIKEQVLNTL
jgi:uncharacterized protein (TIGR00255 family)